MWKPEKPFFLKIFASYAVLLVLLFVMGAVLSVHAQNEVREQIEANGEETLVQVEKAFKAEFSNVEMLLTQISMIPEVRSFLLEPKRGEAEDAYRLKQVINGLSSYSLLSDFIGSYYIWFWKNDYVVTRSYAYPSRDFFRLCYGEQEMDYGQWEASKKGRTPYLGYERTAYAKLEGSRRIIEYGLSLPLGVGNALGSITVQVDESQVHDLLTHSAPSGLRYAYIADSHGSIVTCYGTEEGICAPEAIPEGNRGHFSLGSGKERLYLSYARSEDGKWLYVIACSPLEMLSPVVGMRNRYMLLLCILLGVSLVCALAISFRQARPLREMVRSLATEEMSPHDLKTLKEAVNNLVRDNDLINKEREKGKEVLRSVFLLRLLLGTLPSGKTSIDEEFGKFHVALSPCYQVVLVYFGREYAENQLFDCRLVLKRKIAEATVALRVEPVDIDSRTVACICFNDNPDNGDFGQRTKKTFSLVSREVEQVFRLHLDVVYGDVVDSTALIQESYGQAAYALQNKLLGGSGDGRGMEGGTGYTLAMEMKLVRFVHEGNKEAIRVAVSDLFRQNEMFIHADNDQLRITLTALKHTLLRILHSSSLDSPLLDLQVESLEKLDQEAITKAFVDVVDAIASSSREAQKDFSRKMLSFVDAHCLEKMFSLGMVSDHFHLNETYVSTYFKKQYGVNFLAYVKKKRMREGMRLLGDPQLSVEEISGMAGYASSHSFRRAFKETYGISPVEYRSR